MTMLPEIFANNRTWANEIQRANPTFFETLAKQQSPEYLWIGCADSRVPANQIIGLLPGEVFVHRNVANLVHHTDLNCLSVVQYAVEVLHVKHIIVCGHYGCGGVKAAMQNQPFGLIDNWLRMVRRLYQRNEAKLQQIPDAEQQFRRLCELNVIEQVYNLCQTTVIEQAWGRGQNLTVHGWIYGLKDGLLQDLKMCVANADELMIQYQQAIN